MKQQSDDVRLVVNGTEYGGWKSVEITAGIERQVRDFSLSVTDKWPGQTDIPRRIRWGDVCEVYIGNDKVLTGYVDGTPINYDAESVSVGVTGRSKTEDLVDCSAINSPGSWSAAKIERIVSDMAGVYGIEVVTEVDTGQPLAHAIEQGESVFESTDRMLKLRQLLATDDGDGRLVFIKVGSAGTARTALVLGENIKAASAPLNFKDVFSEIICKGQRAGNDQDFGTAVSEESAVLKETNAPRRRVLLIKSSGQTDSGTAAERVRYEMAHRKAKALEAVYTVRGWRQENGDLWRHNMLVRITDPVIGFDQQMVISEITYAIDKDDGRISRMKVGPVDGYINNPGQTGAKRDAGAKVAAGEWKDVRPADTKAPRVANTGAPKGGEWSDVKRGR